jgi:hypothetical protein
MTVFVYVNTSKQVGDAEHVKVFATTDAAEKWFEENDPEGRCLRISGDWNYYRLEESEIGFRSPAPKPRPERRRP